MDGFSHFSPEQQLISLVKQLVETNKETSKIVKDSVIDRAKISKTRRYKNETNKPIDTKTLVFQASKYRQKTHSNILWYPVSLFYIFIQDFLVNFYNFEAFLEINDSNYYSSRFDYTKYFDKEKDLSKASGTAPYKTEYYFSLIFNPVKLLDNHIICYLIFVITTFFVWAPHGLLGLIHFNRPANCFLSSLFLFFTGILTIGLGAVSLCWAISAFVYLSVVQLLKSLLDIFFWIVKTFIWDVLASLFVSVCQSIFSYDNWRKNVEADIETIARFFSTKGIKSYQFLPCKYDYNYSIWEETDIASLIFNNQGANAKDNLEALLTIVKIHAISSADEIINALNSIKTNFGNVCFSSAGSPDSIITTKLDAISGEIDKIKKIFINWCPKNCETFFPDSIKYEIKEAINIWNISRLFNFHKTALQAQGRNFLDNQLSRLDSLRKTLSKFYTTYQNTDLSNKSKMEKELDNIFQNHGCVLNHPFNVTYRYYQPQQTYSNSSFNDTKGTVTNNSATPTEILENAITIYRDYLKIAGIDIKSFGIDLATMTIENSIYKKLVLVLHKDKQVTHDNNHFYLLTSAHQLFRSGFEITPTATIGTLSASNFNFTTDNKDLGLNRASFVAAQKTRIMSLEKELQQNRGTTTSTTSHSSSDLSSSSSNSSASNNSFSNNPNIMFPMPSATNNPSNTTQTSSLIHNQH